MEQIPENERIKSHQERPLLFFRSPVNEELDKQTSEKVDHTPNDAEAELRQEKSKSSAFSFLSRTSHFSSKQPPLHHHHEATPSELFFDLFFVANLATYTDRDKITNIEGVANYIGFFCVLWFTWYQIALYDVRFSRDSVFDRICKLGQFGVMTGFSFVAYYFDPAGQTPTNGNTGYVDGKAFSLILMSSRLILMVQYSIVLAFLWKYRESRTPIILTIIGSFLAAMIFLGVSFKFGTDSANSKNSIAYCTWYVVSVVESLLTMIVSCVWRSVSFKDTHLCERMSLLTLIILGEGILGLSRAITYVWGNVDYYPGLGVAVASVIILLNAFFRLYFDTIAQNHFGSIRQQIWAFLHFPLHLALVLFDEGMKQFVIWSGVIKQTVTWVQIALSKNIVSTVFTNFSLENRSAFSFRFTGDMNSTQYFATARDDMWAAYNSLIQSPFAKGLNYTVDYSQLETYANNVANGVNLATADIITDVNGFFSTVVKATLDSFNVSAKIKPDGTVSEAAVALYPNDPAGQQELIDAITLGEAVLNLFDLVFRYFYIGTGIALLFILALWLLSKRSKNSWFDYLRYGAWFAVGATISFLALIDMSHSSIRGHAESFVNSAWVLPLPMVLVVLLTVVFHLPFAENRGRIRTFK